MMMMMMIMMLISRRTTLVAGMYERRKQYIMLLKEKRGLFNILRTKGDLNNKTFIKYKTLRMQYFQLS